MKNVHVNTVGSDQNNFKSIYVIKNDVNDKVYVGQSSDIYKRFISHCKINDSLISIAIRTIGKEHFWVEMLEENVPNSDEREMYWIEKLGSKAPNGYNLMSGGLNTLPIVCGAVYPESMILKIKTQLRSTKMPLQAIALDNNISKRQVLRINQGLIYSSTNETYPIRETPNPNGKLTEEDVDSIIELLKYSYWYDGYIAKQFGVEVHAISRINKGIAHRRDDIKYPIRNWKSCGVCLFTYEDITDIMYMLKYTDLSMNQISRRYHVGVNTIMIINNGSSKKFRRDGVNYPLRKYRDKQHFDRSL